MKKSLLIACLSSLNLLAAGCGGDPCVDICEDLKECSDATAEQKSQDCEAVCEQDAEDAETMGCADQRETLFDCTSESKDVCDLSGILSCVDESTEYVRCVEGFCISNPESGLCTNE